MIEAQLEEQNQHHPTTEYIDSAGHVHRCFTVRYDGDLYYIDFDPLEHGARRNTGINSLNIYAIPALTRGQLARLTAKVSFDNVAQLFTKYGNLGNASIVKCNMHGDMLYYAIFVTHAHKAIQPDDQPRKYAVKLVRGYQMSTQAVLPKHTYLVDDSVVNYAWLIKKYPVYAYCDVKYFSRDCKIIVDSSGAHHILKAAACLPWACRHVPLGTQTVFNTRGRIPYYDGANREDNYKCIKVCTGSLAWAFYAPCRPEVTWFIKHGMVFHEHVFDRRALCEECCHHRYCIRTRAGEPYTCIEISRSYYWQYKIRTTFGPAEHARYVKLCKMIYG